MDKGGEEECWIWTACLFRGGYGEFRLDGRSVKAHRFAYIEAKGAIPPHLELDHLCRKPACVNPSHLEAISHRENVRRGELANSNRARGAAITHCAHGHEYSAENTYIKPTGWRECRACRSDRMRAFRERKQAVA